jgi:CRP/FNR family transcriptional regulator, cyclic AMP receptor protein
MATTSAAASLEHVPLLADLTQRDRQRLARMMRERTFAAGRGVVVEGRNGVGFFIIAEGKAVVSIGERVISVLGPGDYFGEMALLHGGERSATVTADTELRCLTITAWGFKSFVLEHPNVAWALLQTLAQRMRANAAL